MISDYISVRLTPPHAESPSTKRTRSSGVPYTLYAIYGIGSSSLYYIGHGANSLKLAVATPTR